MKQVVVDIVCPWWKRPEITELHAWSMDRFMKAAPKGVQCQYWAILSPEDDPCYDELLRIAQAHGFNILEAPNKPVASKLNHGIYTVSEARGRQRINSTRWIMNIGSDDLVDPDYWKLCYQYISSGPGHLYAVDRLFLCDEAVQNVFLLHTFNPGALRFIRLWAIQALKDEYNIDIYPPEINRTMDGRSAENLAMMGIKWENMIDGNTYIIDVKTRTNITKLTGFMRFAADGSFTIVDTILAKRFFPPCYRPRADAFAIHLGIPPDKAINRGMTVGVFDNGSLKKGKVNSVLWNKHMVELKPSNGRRFSKKHYSFNELHLL